MKAAAFEYHAPRSLRAATDLLARYADEDARILAGGQSLVPAMALRVASPAHLIDINGVDELSRLTVGGEGHVAVRACVRHATFQRPVEPGPLGDLLSKVVRYIAHYPIRTRGTMCGSLANADPASEWCLVAATLEAELTAISSRGTPLDPGARLVPRSDDNRTSTRRAPAAGAVPGTSIGFGFWLPGVQPSRRRFRLGDGSGHVPCPVRSYCGATCRCRCGRAVASPHHPGGGSTPRREAEPRTLRTGRQSRSRVSGSADRRTLRRCLSSRSDPNDDFARLE